MDKKGYMRISDYLINLQQAFNLNYEGKKALNLLIINIQKMG